MGLNIYETIDNKSNQNPVLYVEGKQNLEVGGYIGPKYVDVLRKIDPQLTAVVDYGIMTFLAKPMFSVLNLIMILPKIGG